MVRIGPEAPDAASIVTAAEQAGVPLDVLTLHEPIVAEIYEAKLVLVRPDLMIAWRADEPPQGPAALIDTVRGA